MSIAAGLTSRSIVRRMVSRDPNETHRAATPLELLYDLCFVVAIARAAHSLHHSISAGHGAEHITSFMMVFVAIWWAWMGFAWFASAFDTDDAPYRIKVLIQMLGVLVLAAGVPRAFEHHDFLLITIGYAIMRIGLVAQWLRAARAAPEYRLTCLRYAAGISVLQIFWIGLLFMPAELKTYGWLVLVPAELTLPAWAEFAKPTSWHPHHIAERYGLLTIIVIGESVLATTLAIQTAIDEGIAASDLIWTILGAPLIIFSMWWLYFARPHHARLTSMRRAFLWGYGHYFVFASAAAVGAGLAVAVDTATHHAQISATWAGQAIAIPVAIYIASLWCGMFCGRSGTARITTAFAVCMMLTLAVPMVIPAAATLAIGVLLASLTMLVVLD